jgi:hypothetical protein
MYITLNYAIVQHTPSPQEVMEAVRYAALEGNKVAFIVMRPEQKEGFIQDLRDIGDGPIRMFAGATLIEKEGS